MKKSTLILLLTFLFAGLGILSFILVPGRRALVNNHWFYQISSWISPLDLVIFNSYGKWYTRPINLIFMLLLLVGGIINVINHKEIRLIRFVFSLIFLSAIADFISLTIRLSFPNPALAHSSGKIFDVICASISITLMAGVSWYVLNIIKGLRTLQPNQSPELFPNDKWQRSSQGARLLHFLLDDLLAILTISKIMIVFSYTGKAEMMIHLLGRSGALGFAILVIRIVYYILSESILQSTPGKFLTESRVINERGENPGFFGILLRTACRFIPFDNFSFLWQGNWHDRFSNTLVVKETQKQQKDENNFV